MVGVLILSDICLYREGLELVLQNDSCITVLGTASSADEAIEKVSVIKPHAALIDMAMRQALTAVRRLTAAAPHLTLVALAVSEAENEILACAEAGIAGYVTREGSVVDLVRIVQATVKGELHCTPRVAASLLRRVADLASVRNVQVPLDSLTAQELRVLCGIERGLSNKEIALQLNIEVSTVKNHVHNILEKLGVRRRGEAAALMRPLLNRGAATPVFAESAISQGKGGVEPARDLMSGK